MLLFCAQPTDSPARKRRLGCRRMIALYGGGNVSTCGFSSGCALPDFEAACKRVNVPYTAFARPKMVHCYCMLPVFREAKEDFAKIAEILKQ